MNIPFFNDKIFRFRSASRLLRGGEQIPAELETQSIFFCPPTMLNDPIDGDIDVYFQGDEIAWKGIFRNYFCCLYTSICVLRLSHNREDVLQIVPQNHFQNSPYEQMAEQKCRELIASKIWESVERTLCNKKLSLWKVKMYFEIFHHIILDMVIDSLSSVDAEVYAFFKRIVTPEIVDAATNGIIEYIKAVDAETDYGESRLENIVKMKFNALSVWKQVKCISGDCNRHALSFIVENFADEYFNKLRDSVFFKWGVASFSTDYSSPLVWSHYGDAHKGVCLIFDNEIEHSPNSKNCFTNIEEINGKTAIGYGGVEFMPVNYSNTNNEINFFEALGTWSHGGMQKLLTFDGKTSGIYTRFCNDKWREEYIKSYRETLSRKTKSWEYEKEVRLILGGLHDRFGAGGYVLNYNFERLVGIIFGVKTAVKDKDEIFKIIVDKCAKSGRDIEKFIFFQAQYNKEHDIIETVPLVCPYSAIKQNSGKEKKLKIKLYGTGSLAAKSLSACALIDDTILFDCPNGLVKRLRQDDVNFGKIKVVIISHYHADHDWDLPFFLLEIKRVAPNEKLTLIVPKGYRERYKSIFDVMWVGAFNYEMMNEGVTILEAEDKSLFEIDGYKILSYKMLHVDCDAYGYRIEKSGKTVAFTGDSAINDNIMLLIENSDVAFVDATGSSLTGISKAHFTIEELVQLREKTGIRIVPTHMDDTVRGQLKELGFNPPSDGDTIEL